MGNCLKNSKQSKPASARAPETESRKRRRSENKCKKVHFDAHVEVFGRSYDREADEEEEEERNEIKEQLRIRITKKQLEELLGRVELQSLSVHEMMNCLAKEHLTDLKYGDCHNPLEPHNLQLQL